MLDTRKDNNPIKTVNLIKRILKDNNIKVKEYKIKNINNKFFSIRVEVKGFYNMGTNGKGITKNFAKASAYAELMERIASRNLVNNYFLNKEINTFNFNDEYIDNNVKVNKKILNSFIDKNATYKNLDKKYSILSDYFNPITSEKVPLPIKLINFTTLSNGLCAGNTYHEALCQGISEVLERNSYKTILKNEKSLNNIIIDNNLPIYRRINDLEKLGYHFEIKDCTLGKYPVIGLLIMDSKKEKYLFTVGSDPNINIAIQRCLTEAFQGLNNDLELFNKMKHFENNYDNLTENEKITNWLKNYASNNGIHPINIFKNGKNIDYKKLNVFIDKKTNIDNYNYLLNLLQKNNHDLYIKDYSYLSFPVYKVFIPTLSNIFTIKQDEEKILCNNDLLKNIYFDIYKDFNKEDLIKAIETLKIILNIDKYSFMNMGNYFHSRYYIKTNYNNISFELIYALLCYKLDDNYQPSSDIKNKQLCKYLKNIELKNIKNKLNFIIKDLKLKVPSCPNCKQCKCFKYCKYKNWLKFNETLKNKSR